ncbi:MAG: DMT family transporter [Vitreoscilla sp.]|nr:DMT family transporter [Burkholderiales bacterium]MBP6338746.1 DMT family transporter [Vitreoscilla sp.]MBP6674911.1 DMT family transporter [Vitreoscilla sp.]
MNAPHAAGWRPVAGLLFNAMVWGLAWWPMRQLQSAGLHPLWATAIIFAIAVVVIGLHQPAAWRELATQPPLWLILLAAGTTNAAFNWGVTVGDVVRVILLFYLMPLWAVLLARVVLHERITPSAMLRVAMALVGAAIVLWPSGERQAAPFNPIDLLGLLGGFSFAVNNIMLKRESHRLGGGRGLAMFLGGCVVSLVLALALPQVPGPPPLAWPWLLGALALGTCFVLSNLALQYGVSHLPANATAVIMLTEVLWATVSALALGAGSMSFTLALGGGLIVGAAALAALKP